MGVTSETTAPSSVASVPSGQTSKKENVITKSVEKVKETTTVCPSKLRDPVLVRNTCSVFHEKFEAVAHLFISFTSLSSSVGAHDNDS
jgi:hypothetical protein